MQSVIFARNPVVVAAERSALSCLALTCFLAACSEGNRLTPIAAPPPPDPAPPPEPTFTTRELLGEALFFDVNLSLNRTQACATCHDPARAYTDNRLDAFGQPVAFSVGDDGFSQASRNAPTVTYTAFAPGFGSERHPRFNSQQPDYEGFVGGQFWDGRAETLENQAKNPPLGADEMAMPSKAAVIDRIRENADYEASFELVFGYTIFDNIEDAYDAMAASIGAYERTDVFNTFDSKYDRSLTGDYVFFPGSKEALGRALFFSQQFTNCATCHQLAPNGNRHETFTSYEYHNIGTPINEEARLAANLPLDELDPGLLANPQVDDPAQAGKYKVPTLRNVAVTAPYMNNGVFRSLDTVLRFYDHFQAGSDNQINPETGAPWRESPFPDTVSTTELEDGRPLSDNDIEALVCFMRSLTDQRFEDLLPDDGLRCD
ncbi:MAG: cytochrome c peroxidase [Pseudomonadota bacterium]